MRRGARNFGYSAAAIEQWQAALAMRVWPGVIFAPTSLVGLSVVHYLHQMIIGSVIFVVGSVASLIAAIRSLRAAILATLRLRAERIEAQSSSSSAASVDARIGPSRDR
jgi:hypothetical protein